MKPLFKRPMLACSLLKPDVPTTDENILKAMSLLKYPVLASIKKDGIRALRMNGTLLSRRLKKIPNESIRERSLILPGGFDMELWAPGLRYDEIESIVMSRKHPDSDKIEFHILDWFGIEGGFVNRLEKAFVWIVDNAIGVLDIPIHTKFNDSRELFDCFIQSEENGHEGICFRTLNSPYKQGRSTLKEQYLIKLCRLLRKEVTIVGFEEQMENGNPSNYNAVGYMDRSSCKDNLLGKNTLGAFIVYDNNSICPTCKGIKSIEVNEPYEGKRKIWCPSCNGYGHIIYTVGTGVGLTDKLRKEIWENRDKYINKQITIKYKPHNEKEKPRSPIFVGFREEI